MKRVIVIICMQISLVGALAGTLPAQVQARPARQVPVAVIGFTPSAPGSRFLPGQPVSAMVSITNDTSLTMSYTRTETVTDYLGNVTSLLTDTVTLATGQVTSSPVRVPVTRLGYYQLSVSLTDQASKQVVSGSLPIAVMQPQAPSADPKSPFGLSGSLVADSSNPQALAATSATLTAAGVRYVREGFDWNLIEPTAGSGRFNFGRADAAVIAAHAAGIQILGLLAYWGNLSQPEVTSTVSGTDVLATITGCTHAPACAYTPQANALFATYAAAVVNRYKSGGTLAQQQGWTDGYGIEDWEVWNEPSTFWRHDLIDYAQRFAALLSAATTAIHTSDPHAQVMYCESGHAFSDAIAAANIPYDILAVHSYPGALDPDTALISPTLPRGGQGTAPAALGELVAAGKPVWVTETGYSTNGSVTPRQQAQYLVRSFVDFLAQGVQRQFWFKFREDASPDEPAGPFGIVTAAGYPKPAYLAYTTMTDHLQDTVYTTTVQLGTAVRAALFSRADGATVATLWSTAENGSIAIPVGTATVAAADIMNNPVGQQTNGTFTVLLSGDAVFLTVAHTTPAQLASMLQAAQIASINPVGVSAGLAPGLANGLPDVLVTVSARTNVPISGTITLALPGGWAANATALRFSSIRPGQTSTVRFKLTSVINHPSDVLSATASTLAGFTSSSTTPVTQYALTYGHPAIDGTLATWAAASEADLINLRPDQVVGIVGWTPQNLSAKIYTMWDEKYFYLAADVTDVHFDYAPIGFNLYQGDSIQYGWGMDPAAYLRDSGPNRYNVSIGLTHQGAQNYQYNLRAALPDVLQAIKPDPKTGDLIYTTAIPWSRLGNYVPVPGQQFAFNLLINQNENHHREGWIAFAPGIGIGFYPSQWPLWTIEPSNPVAGLRVGGLYAPLQGSITFNLPLAHGQVAIHDGGLQSLSMLVNTTPITVTAGNATGQFKPFSTTVLDLSRYLRAGQNTVQATGVPSMRGNVAVLSFFQ